MKCLYFDRILAVIGVALMTASAFAQERQGNIVEYFGKEKVTEVREGTVRHTFTDGLILRRIAPR